VYTTKKCIRDTSSYRSPNSCPGLPDARAQRAAYKRALFIQKLRGEGGREVEASTEGAMSTHMDQEHGAHLAAAPEASAPKIPPLNLGVLDFEEPGAQVATVAVRGVRTKWPLLSRH
jgi:hypothetical protein